MTVNADLETKTHHQTPMTCTYGSVILDTYKTVATEMKYNFKYMNYVPIVVATDLEVHFSVLKKGVPILLSILCKLSGSYLMCRVYIKS